MTWRLGTYRVDDRPFAAGATAEVFAARRGRTGPRVAIKVLPLRTFRERAEAEADVAAIDHPRLLSVHERVVDERRGVVGLVMDLADEGDLRSALRSTSPPSAIEMLQIADDVLAALDALHAVGLVHRDVKPENVMLERVAAVRRARLGDLGITRPADRTRSTGSVLGTDLYIAPEVHDGASPSVRSDLWAVGYVLYEGLFGAPPHADAATTYQAIGRLRAEGPDRPSRVPDAIWHVVATLLAPRPEDRPESADAARALVATAGPAALAIAPSPTPERPAARRRSTPRGRSAVRFEAAATRSPGVTRALVGAAALAVVVGGLTWAGDGRLFDRPSASIGAIRSVTPLAPGSRHVVPTQYQWRLRDGVLTGRLAVSNPSSEPTAAAVMPEVFPATASTDGKLAIAGFSGDAERQDDGSVLVRFEVPPLAPRAHHVVAFRVTVPTEGDDPRALAQLVRDRDATIKTHAFSLSTAPTLDRLEVEITSSSLVVGQHAQVSVQGYDRQGTLVPPELLREVEVAVTAGLDVARVEGTALAALAPGDAVISAVIGELRADVPLTVTAPPAPPTTAEPAPAPRRPRQTFTTDTTTVEETPSNPPPEAVVL